MNVALNMMLASSVVMMTIGLSAVTMMFVVTVRGLKEVAA